MKKLRPIEALQSILEQKSAGEFIEAQKCIGVDNYSDVYHQGRGQAFREAAKLVADFKKAKP